MATVTADGKSWQFDEGDLLNTEMIAIERQTGLTNDEFWDACRRGSFIALTALVWTLRRRDPDDDPNLAYDGVVFKAASFDIDQSDDVGKDSAAGTAPSSKTSSSSTPPSSPAGTAFAPGSSAD